MSTELVRVRAEGIFGWRHTAAMVGIAALFAVAFSVIFVHGEDHVYTWDFRFYWQAYYVFGDLIQTDFLGALKQMLSQIRSSEYNPTPVILLLPFEFAFGHSREGYISAIAVLYLVPASFMAAELAFAAATSGNDREHDYRQRALFQVLAILFPPFWTPTLRGFLDVIGIVPLAAAGYLVLRSEIGRSICFKRAIVLGFLLWLPFLFRKWYAYSIIAFFISAGFFNLYSSVTTNTRDHWRTIVIRVAGFYALSSLVLLSFVVLVQYRLAVHAAITNYSDINSGWQVSAVEHFIRFKEHFGLIWIVIAAAGLIAPAIAGRCIAATVFVVMNLTLTFYLFTRTQAFGMQHYLPVALWLYVLSCMGVSQLTFSLQGVRRGVAICCILGTVGALFYGTYCPLPEWGSRVVAGALPARLNQIKFENYANYQRVIGDLGRYMQPIDTFSVFASSEILSDSLMHALSENELDRQLVYASQVDLRDHFDVRPLLTRFVLIADPVQIHLSEAAQQVITQPASRILRGIGIGQAYSKLPSEYELADGVKAYLFEKKRSFTTSEIDDLLEGLFSSYPEWRREYYLRRLLLVADISLGDRLGLIYPETVIDSAAFDGLVMRPGETTETRLSIPDWNSKETFGQSYSALEMFIPEMRSTCPDAGGVKVEINLASQRIWHGAIVPGKIQRVALPLDLVGWFVLDVNNGGSAACDELHVKFLGP